MCCNMCLHRRCAGLARFGLFCGACTLQAPAPRTLFSVCVSNVTEELRGQRSVRGAALHPDAWLRPMQSRFVLDIVLSSPGDGGDGGGGSEVVNARHRWVVVNQLGGGEATAIARHDDNRHMKLLPWVRPCFTHVIVCVCVCLFDCFLFVTCLAFVRLLACCLRARARVTDRSLHRVASLCVVRALCLFQGGIAARISGDLSATIQEAVLSTAVVGKAFCFLPLPVFTSFPVHVRSCACNIGVVGG